MTQNLNVSLFHILWHVYSRHTLTVTIALFNNFCKYHSTRLILVLTYTSIGLHKIFKVLTFKFLTSYHLQSSNLLGSFAYFISWFFIHLITLYLLELQSKNWCITHKITNKQLPRSIFEDADVLLLDSIFCFFLLFIYYCDCSLPPFYDTQ